MQYPTLHKPVPMGAKVRLPQEWFGKTVTGEVVGVASIHVLYTYIILLDDPITNEIGVQRACVCPGPQLEGLDGTNWRFVDEAEQAEYMRCF